MTGQSGQGQGGGNGKPTPSASTLAPHQVSLPVVPKSAGKARCYRCQQSKPLAEFARDKSKATGRKSICKDCDKAKSRRYYTENAERVIARVIERRKTRGVK